MKSLTISEDTIEKINSLFDEVFEEKDNISMLDIDEALEDLYDKNVHYEALKKDAYSQEEIENTFYIASINCLKTRLERLDKGEVKSYIERLEKSGCKNSAELARMIDKSVHGLFKKKLDMDKLMKFAKEKTMYEAGIFKNRSFVEYGVTRSYGKIKKRVYLNVAPQNRLQVMESFFEHYDFKRYIRCKVEAGNKKRDDAIVFYCNEQNLDVVMQTVNLIEEESPHLFERFENGNIKPAGHFVDVQGACSIADEPCSADVSFNRTRVELLKSSLELATENLNKGSYTREELETGTLYYLERLAPKVNIDLRDISRNVESVKNFEFKKTLHSAVLDEKRLMFESEETRLVNQEDISCMNVEEQVLE